MTESFYCKDCNLDLPITDFSIKSNGKPQWHCKKCQREYSRRHYALNKTEHNKRRYANKRLKRPTHYEFVQNLKTQPCEDCHKCYHPVCMDFDHVRGVKKFNISVAVVRCYSKDKLLEEIDKCELVCSNCHRLRTYSRITDTNLDLFNLQS